MIHLLGGGSEKDPADYYGKTITAAEILDERLRIKFSDGVAIEVFDNGQSCCENRYMTTDDDVASLVGNKLTAIEAKPGPEVSNDDDAHEQVFVEIVTDKGFITLVNHNEHNGYYGGFGLTVTERDE